MTDRRMKQVRHIEAANKFAAKIEAAIKDAGRPLTRTEICELTEISESSVLRHTKKLIDKKRLYIVEVQLFDDGSFRPTLNLGPGDGSEPERVRVRSQSQRRPNVSVSWLGQI